MAALLHMSHPDLAKCLIQQKSRGLCRQRGDVFRKELRGVTANVLQTVQGEGDGGAMMSEDTENRCALALCADLQTVIFTYVCMFIHFHDI